MQQWLSYEGMGLMYRQNLSNRRLRGTEASVSMPTFSWLILDFGKVWQASFPKWGCWLSQNHKLLTAQIKRYQ